MTIAERYYYYNPEAGEAVITTAQDIISTFRERVHTSKWVKPKYFYKDGSMWQRNMSGGVEEVQRGIGEGEVFAWLLNQAIIIAPECDWGSHVFTSRQDLIDYMEARLIDGVADLADPLGYYTLEALEANRSDLDWEDTEGLDELLTLREALEAFIEQGA